MTYFTVVLAKYCHQIKLDMIFLLRRRITVETCRLTLCRFSELLPHTRCVFVLGCRKQADDKVYYVKIQHNFALLSTSLVDCWVCISTRIENKVYRWLIVVFYFYGCDRTVISPYDIPLHTNIFFHCSSVYQCYINIYAGIILCQ